MRPLELTTKIFLDGGDPQETKEILSLLGFLDGQTTNPTHIAKSPTAARRLAAGEKFSREEVYAFYRSIAEEISALIPAGSVSIEVYADARTTARDMIAEGRQLYAWIPNAHIKLPTTPEGLEAAEELVKEGMRVNMTLCFSERQAAAVYRATRGARRGQVLVSPFDGRLDDQNEQGMGLIKNIQRLYAAGDGHVAVLAASIRNVNHLLYALYLKVDIVTAPAPVLTDWAALSRPVPASMPDVDAAIRGRRHIEYEPLKLTGDWRALDISHPLTRAGVEKFAHDWNSLIG